MTTAGIVLGAALAYGTLLTYAYGRGAMPLSAVAGSLVVAGLAVVFPAWVGGAIVISCVVIVGRDVLEARRQVRLARSLRSTSTTRNP